MNVPKQMPNGQKPNLGKKLVLIFVAIFALSPSFATEDNFFGQIGEFLNNLDVEFSITAPVVQPTVQRPTVIRQPTIIRQPVIQRPVIQRPVIQQPVVIQRPVVRQPVVIQRPIVQRPVVRQPVYVPVQPTQPTQPRYIPYNGGTYGNGYSNTNGQYSSQVTVSTTPYSGGSYSGSSYTSSGYTSSGYAPVTNNSYTTVTYSGAASSGALSNGYFNLVPGEGYVIGYGMAMTLLDITTNRYGDAVLHLAFSYNGETRNVRVSIPHGEQPILKVGGKRLQLVGLEHGHGSQYVRCYLTD